MKILAGLGIVLGLGAASGARADDMGQGEARITARSDVTMSIESGARTTSMKLSKVAKHLGTPLGDIKRCYADIIEENPAVAGHMDVALTYAEKGPLQVELSASDLASKALKRCVSKAFAKVKLEEELRPARAVVKLDFTNTAAEAAPRVEEKRAEMAEVEVQSTGDGRFFSTDGTADGKIRFRVEGATEAAVTAAHHGLEGALPRLLDCRRRAGKRGSPAGEVVFDVALKPKGKARVDAVSSSVAHPNARPCSLTALRRASFDAGNGRARVVVSFGD